MVATTVRVSVGMKRTVVDSGTAKLSVKLCTVITAVPDSVERICTSARPLLSV